MVELLDTLLLLFQLIMNIINSGNNNNNNNNNNSNDNNNNNLNDNSMVTINAPAPMNVNIAVPGGRSGRGVSDDGDECSVDPEIIRILASCLRRLQCPLELETRLEHQYRLSLQAEIQTFLINMGARGDDLDLQASDYCSVDVFDVCSPLL